MLDLDRSDRSTTYLTVQVKHSVGLNHHVGILQQVLRVDRLEVALAWSRVGSSMAGGREPGFFVIGYRLATAFGKDWNSMLSKLALVVPLLAICLAVGACGEGSSAVNSAASSASAGATSPTVTPTPAVTPSPTPTPRPTPTPTKTATRPATQPATADAAEACTAVRGPLERAAAGLVTLKVIVDFSESTDDDVHVAWGEATTRLSDLKMAADNAINETSNTTLRSNLRALSQAAYKLGDAIYRAKFHDRDKLGALATQTDGIELAINKLEPSCAKYWG